MIDNRGWIFREAILRKWGGGPFCFHGDIVLCFLGLNAWFCSFCFVSNLNTLEGKTQEEISWTNLVRLKK